MNIPVQRGTVLNNSHFRNVRASNVLAAHTVGSKT